MHRADRSAVRGVLSRAEYHQQAERNIVTAALELRGTPSARRVEHRQRAERGIVSEPS
jgi:hypothetical protein